MVLIPVWLGDPYPRGHIPVAESSTWAIMTSSSSNAEVLNSVGTLPEYFEQIRRAPDQGPVLGLKDQSSPDGIRLYTSHQLLDLGDKAVAYYRGILNDQLSKTTNCDNAPVVGIAAYGNIQWAATCIALARLGCTILALSIRLSPNSMEALLLKTGASAIIFGAPVQLPHLASVKTIPIMPLAQLQDDGRNEVSNPTNGVARPLIVPNVALIWHSSGSTGTPKTFPMIQKTLMARLTSAERGPLKDQGVFITSSMFNSAGLTFLLTSFSKRAPVLLWDDETDYTPDSLAGFLTAARPEMAIFAPSILAEAAKSEQAINVLRQCRSVGTFGALCPKELGDRLVALGIRFYSGYALSEASQIMTSISRPGDDTEWDYMEPYPNVKPFLFMKPVQSSSKGSREDTLYEAIVLEGYPNCPPGIATGDLFLKHLSKPDRWKIVGRKDDQINMGVPVWIKLDANDYESVIKTAIGDEAEEVVLFGNGRPKLGLLVFRKQEDTSSPEYIKESVWKVVEADINPRQKIPIEKDMIVVVDGNVPRTDKGNFMRSMIYVRYESAIQQAYQNRASEASL